MRKTLPTGARCRLVCRAGVVALAATIGGPASTVADGPSAGDQSVAPAVVGLGEFLAARGIDRAGRRPIEEAAAWDDAVQQAALRVLLRLAAPPELARRWRAEAVGFEAGPPEVEDRLVAVRGRAVFVAPQPLAAEQRELAGGRTHFDVVRIVDASGAAADVVVLEAPRAWARGRPIDEPAAAFGLPLSARVGPRPDGWPTGSPALVAASSAVAWFPATRLGALGMDYALFDAVVDGRRLEPAESDAFFAALAAAGKMPDAPAGKPTDIVPLIDPAQQWFATHRGDEVVIAGVARKATRIAIDEPARRAELGTDHYWQLFVFVPTPTLSVDGNLQDSFPVVCDVLDLPDGMPTGDQISEWVVVPGFAFKRYAYPLPDAVIGDEVRQGERRETPLVLGRRAIWRSPPSPRGTSDLLLGALAVLGVLAAAALAWRGRSMRRAEARARAELPATFTLPPDRD